MKTKKAFYVKLLYQNKARRILGTSAKEEYGLGSLVIYDGSDVVARFTDSVDKWWTEEE